MRPTHKSESAVHLPLSGKAHEEARRLLLPEGAVPAESILPQPRGWGAGLAAGCSEGWGLGPRAPTTDPEPGWQP